MIHLDSISKRYQNGHEALAGVSLSISAGEMVFLTGRSGAGKSTMLKIMSAIELVSSGQIVVNGCNITRIHRRDIPFFRRDVGVIFQDHRLLYDRTVFDNVALPLVIAGLGHQEIGRRVRAALDKVALLKKEKRYPIELSGGEQQRVGIARAVVNRPELLLADEPTGNLDPGLSAEIMNLFRQFNQVGVTVMIASHDIDLINRMGQRMLTLSDGRLIDDRVSGLGIRSGLK